MPWTAKQLKLFRAAAHNPAIAKSSGIKKSDAERMSKEGLKMARGGIAQQKINKQNTRHGAVDLPVANLNRFAGMKKGGIMKKRRFDEGGDVGSLEDEGFDKSGDGEDTVYRKSFAGGVKMSDEAPAPKAAPAAKPALRNYGDEKDSGPKEDTRAVTGSSNPRRMGFRREMPSASRKEENAQNLAKELATTAAMGGAGKLAHSVYRVGKAANAARNLGLAKGNAAASGEGAAWGEFAQQGAPNSQKFLDKISKANERKFAKRREAESGMKKGGAIMKNMFKGKETYGEEMKEAKAIKSGKISPKQYAMGEKSEEKMKKGGMPMKDGKPSFMKKFAKGGVTGKSGYVANGKRENAPMGDSVAGENPKIQKKGLTEGRIIKMASGGSVSSASRRADGIAQRGKTRC